MGQRPTSPHSLNVAVTDDLYTFNFLDPETAQLCLHTSAPGKSLFLLKSKQYVSDEDARAMYFHRIPVFIGATVLSSMFHESRMIKGTSVDSALHAQNRRCIIGVCAPAAVQNSSSSVWVVHAYAPNLESGRTQDAAAMLRSDGSLDKSHYADRMQELASLIVAGAMHANCSLVLTPALGQGAYLESVRCQADRQFCLDALASALDRTMRSTDLTIELNLLHNMPSNMQSLSSLQVSEGDFFKRARARQSSLGEKLCVVNAWDSHSLIGNGGSRDGSIDGWFVSGTGPGSSFRNSSYLHNPQFSVKQPQVVPCIDIGNISDLADGT